MNPQNPAYGVGGALLIPAAGFAMAETLFSGTLWPMLLGLALLVAGVTLLATFVFGRTRAEAI